MTYDELKQAGKLDAKCHMFDDGESFPLICLAPDCPTRRAAWAAAKADERTLRNSNSDLRNDGN